MAQIGRDDILAGVDRILHVVNELGEPFARHSDRRPSNRSSTTALAREGFATKAALSSRWYTRSH